MPRKNEIDYLAEIASNTVGGVGGGGGSSFDPRGSTSSVTTFPAVANSTTAETLKASNANRKLLTIYNEGAGVLNVLLGSGTASASNYTVKLNPGDYYEITSYTGQVGAIFIGAGFARVTEIST